MFAVENNQDGSLIGFCGLVHPGGQQVPEITYALKRRFRCRGLATETVNAVLSYASRDLDLPCIIATIDSANLASQRVVKKAGMQYQGVVTDDSGLQTQVYQWSRQNQ